MYAVKVKKQKKVTSKQNLEYFKIINQRLFIPKFCNNSKCCCHPPGQYLLEHLCFPFQQGPSFSRLSTRKNGKTITLS